MIRIILKTIAPLILCLIVLTGCTGTQTETESPVANPEQETSVTVETPSDILDVDDNLAYERGNILTVSTTTLTGNFNPLLYESKGDQWVVDLIFEGLIDNDEKGNPVPATATRWDISEDGLTYTFYLDQDIVFHDGMAMTAEDVAFTYYCIADTNNVASINDVVGDFKGIDDYQKGSTDVISGINVIDSNTIAFTFKEVSVDHIWDFVYGIMPKHIYAYENWDEFTAKASLPVGSGLMAFDSFTPNSKIDLMTFEDYHGDRAQIDGIEIKAQPVETATASLAAGQIDLVNPPANLSNYDMMTATNIVSVEEFTTNSYNFIGFNLRNPKLTDVRVRQALAYGLNREAFITQQWEGFASVCNAPVSPFSWAYPGDSALNAYAYDPEKAKALLDEAGWVDTDDDGIRDKDGVKLSLTWLGYNDIDWPMNLVALATENWKAIGVELNAEFVAFSELTESVFTEQQFELFNMGWSLSIDPDPSVIFSKEADVLGGYNAGGYYNERAEAIFETAKITFDQSEREALYKEWGIIANQELPYLFNAYLSEIWGVNQRVKGMSLSPFHTWTQAVKDITLEYVEE